MCSKICSIKTCCICRKKNRLEISCELSADDTHEMSNCIFTRNHEMYKANFVVRSHKLHFNGQINFLLLMSTNFLFIIVMLE